MSRARPTFVAVVAAVTAMVAPAHASGPIVPPIADLELTGSAPAEVANGEHFAHTFTVRNLGPDTAVDVVVEGVDGTELGGACAPSACRLGDLASGATATVTASWAEPAIFPPASGTFRSAARVTSATQDPNHANDAAAVSTYRRPYDGPPISLPPTGEPTPPAPPIPCRRMQDGTAGPDDLRASADGDRLLGHAGADVLRGGPRRDCIWAGAGADRLTGGGGNDWLHPGAGRDRVSGGAGDDVIEALDATRDVIDCGPGRDWIRADRRDRLRSCERVTHRPRPRRAASAAAASSGGVD